MEIGIVKPIKIEDEMRSSYLDYAMSVIVARALPDVRDGLKPAHRRILYAMEDLNLRHTVAYKKSARIVGEVLGKYHPHGDAAVYDTMVRMAQDFSMRYPLIDGQGNFGSVDDDPAAAMRYTEARMTEMAEELLADIEKNTVDFTPNFDGSLQEPTVLPSRIPNLLVNGTAGIAVGMATNIPPHNLGEVCDGIIRLIDNPEASVEELIEYISAPDFPTAGIIQGREGIRSAYSTGHGRIVVRAKAQVEEMRGSRLRIVVTELPFQVNKAALIEKMADLVKERRIEGISELRDESDRRGMRIVIELRRDSEPRQVLNSLFKHTAMQSAFFVNMLALVQGQPRTLTLKGLLQHHIDHRREIITRRSQFDLKKARERAHVLEGLIKALDNLDAVIATIRRSQTAETARTNLMKGFGLTEIQAQAILDMQLRRLAALERKKITDEYAEVLKTMAYLEDLLANPRKILYLIKDEVTDLKKRYGDPRRTLISDQEVIEFREEDLIPHQEVVVTLSQRGYIKRLPSDTYRSQHRGGRGVAGMITREADAVRHLLIADTHDNLLFFTNRGKVYHLKAREVPDASRQARGIPLINLISTEVGEQVTAVVGVPNFGTSNFMAMATRLGEIKKTPLSEFAAVRANGLIAMNLAPKDELVGAKQVRDEDEVILVSQQAQAIRFPIKPLRDASRMSGGVRAMRLAANDRVVALDVVQPNASLLAVTANGFGKRTPLSDYPNQGHGGKGVATFKLTTKTGGVAAAQVVHPHQELMIISTDGIVIRTPLEGIATQGRSTQGVGVMKLGPRDSVASITCLNGSSDPRAKLVSSTAGQPLEGKTKRARNASGMSAAKPPAKLTPGAKSGIPAQGKVAPPKKATLPSAKAGSGGARGKSTRQK